MNKKDILKIIQELIEGNITEMYEETIAFLNRNMKVKVIISDKTGFRTDITQYPLDALREAISNMIIHRLSEASDKLCYAK